MSKFWNINQILTYNALFNFIISFRGGGKTYGFKQYAIKQFIEKGNEFIYLRRYKTDIKKARDNFLMDLDLSKYKNHSFEITNNTLKIDNKTAGYFIALSQSGNYKSVSFPRVTNICFDEFIILNGQMQHYLKDEVFQFNEFYSTVARVGTGHAEVKVFFLGNAVSLINPYFDAFNIQLPYKTQIKTFSNNNILVQIFNSPDLQQEQEKSRFGQIIKDTNSAYFNYAFKSEFKENNHKFIKSKSNTSIFYFCFKLNNKIYGVWRDKVSPDIIISNDFDSNFPILFSITESDMEPNTPLASKFKKSIFWQRVIDAFNYGNLYFESIDIKNKTSKILTSIIL